VRLVSDHPSSSLAEYALEDVLKASTGWSPTESAKFAVVQAEDELAAIGMAMSGLGQERRSMTATFRPDISLMRSSSAWVLAEIRTIVDDHRGWDRARAADRTKPRATFSSLTCSYARLPPIVLHPRSVGRCAIR